MSEVLGLDIGGANLKAAHTSGDARLRPFALWKQPDRLTAELRELLAGWPPFTRLAVTMTGELCDCFATRRDGVQHILSAVEAVAGAMPVDVWYTDGNFHSLAATRANPLGAAAANWLALATFAGRFAANGPALLIDVGSTTTDVVALQDGRPIPQARTDGDRLQSGELVYTGVRRTPLCALLGPGYAAELFATTLDAYLIRGEIPENERDRDTTDGRPATRPFAFARLARMLCSEPEGTADPRLVNLADQIADRQRQTLRHSLDRQPAAPVAIVAGSGEFLARAAWGHRGAVISLGERLGPIVSQAAPAYAVAVLAAERVS